MKFTIRGSDGPTSIFWAGKLGNDDILIIVISIIVLAAAAIALGIYFKQKRKKKDEL